MAIIPFKLYFNWRHSQGIWRLFPFIGVKVFVPWPSTEKSIDPNDSMRSWLEENVGKQGLLWSWHVDFNDISKLSVSFLNKDSAMLFKMIYG